MEWLSRMVIGIRSWENSAVVAGVLRYLEESLESVDYDQLEDLSFLGRLRFCIVIENFKRFRIFEILDDHLYFGRNEGFLPSSVFWET